MQLVILAAGEGTRMRPVTKKIPKPMVPLLGKPKLEYTLDTLPEEIDEVILVVNYLADEIRTHFGSEYAGKKIRYITQEKLNGTGGAIYACKDVLQGNFLVMMGDDLYDPVDVKEMTKHNLAILTFETKEVGRFGKVLEDDEGNFIGIIENGEVSSRFDCKDTALVNTALYTLNQDFFRYELVKISDKEFGLPQTLAKMASSYKIKVLKTKKWIPLGKVDDIIIAEEKLKEMMKN